MKKKLTLKRETIIAALGTIRLSAVRGGAIAVESLTGIPVCVGCETEIFGTCLQGAR